VAQKLHYRLGDKIIVAHGLSEVGEHHDATPFRVVGILARTGTPVDRTLIVSLLGIVAASLLGLVIGVARLSPNWLVSKLAALYIEIFRNVPILLLIMFWNFAVFLPALPGPRHSLGGDGFFLNNRGAYLPRPLAGEHGALWAFLLILFAGIALTWFLNRKKNWQREGRDTGLAALPLSGAPLGLVVTLLGLFLSLLLFGAPVHFDMPVLGRFNLSGGIEIPLPLFSLWFALSTYTAAFIAENVRGGIAAVSRGQWEAAASLGLSRPQMLRLVIIPQALRVIVPPTISQFLNLTKNYQMHRDHHQFLQRGILLS